MFDLPTYICRVKMGYGLKDPERGCFAEVGKVVAIEILWSKPEARDADRRGF